MPVVWRQFAATWVLLLALIPSRVQADVLLRNSPSFVIDTWSTEHGLPQNEVTSILQGRDGYLWLGTHSGLVRFDGIRFTVFDESNTSELKSSRILSLFEDSRTNLWISTANAGVAMINRNGLISLGIGGGGRENRLAAVCEDPGGAVWLYLANGQLWRYQDGATNLFTVGLNQPTDYRGLILEPGGSLWLGTDREMVLIDWKSAQNTSTLPVLKTVPTGGNLDLLVPGRTEGYWRLDNRLIQKWKSPEDRPYLDFSYYPWGLYAGRLKVTLLGTACEDREGNLIVGTLGSGLFWFNPDGSYIQISTAQGLSNDYVYALHVDRDGDLWVGTDGGGLNRLKRPVFDVLEESRGLVVQAVAPDASGGLWIGYTGHPLSYWSKGEQRQAPSPVRTVFVDRQQRVWAGTWGAGLWQVQNNRLRNVPGFDPSLANVSAIYQDRKGRLWIGAQSGLAVWDEQSWKGYSTRDGLTANTVQALADDPDGNVWIGTEGGGLNRWRDGQFTAFRKSLDGLPSDNVSSLFVDQQGVLWVGTEGGGLARLHQGRWTRYTRNDGLISNSIGYIIDDGLGYLWLGSNAGLMRASMQSLNDFARGATNFVLCRVYGKPEGLPIRECSSGTQPGPARGPDGTLWFPTIQGLVSINPTHLKANTNAPPVQIEAVLIDGRAQQEDKFRAHEAVSLVIPHGWKHLEIHYSSLNLAAPTRARFKYRLEGADQDWVDAGDSRVAHFSKLPPGDYQFRVIACNEDGVWNESGAMLGFTITPPFWRTWWFITATTLCVLGSVAGIVYYLSTKKLQQQVLRLRQQEALEKERSRIARDIHDQLGASLTQVALLGELVEGDKDAPHEVEAHARQISQTARDTTRVLDEIVWAVNPANDTLDGLMTYICKYTQEYLSVAGLHYRLDVPEKLPSIQIPPEVRHNIFLACKEAVTNVVRHARASAVWVRLRVLPTSFVLEIEDDGRGLGGLDEKAAQTRNGLKNMRNRMEEIGGEFGFAPGATGGTLVRFTVITAR